MESEQTRINLEENDLTFSSIVTAQFSKYSTSDELIEIQESFELDFSEMSFLKVPVLVLNPEVLIIYLIRPLVDLS